MHYLILIAVILVVIGAAAYFAVITIAFVAALVAIPSIAAMRLIQFVGLTDPDWYVLLHAVLGAAVGFWAHLARDHRIKVILIAVVATIFGVTIVSAVLLDDPLRLLP